MENFIKTISFVGITFLLLFVSILSLDAQEVKECEAMRDGTMPITQEWQIDQCDDHNITIINTK